jgi:hypothetical protein
MRVSEDLEPPKVVCIPTPLSRDFGAGGKWRKGDYGKEVILEEGRLWKAW